jgi:hypothetical protein
VEGLALGNLGSGLLKYCANSSSDLLEDKKSTHYDNYPLLIFKKRFFNFERKKEMKL